MTNFALGLALANVTVRPTDLRLGVTGPNTAGFEPDFKKWSWPAELTGEKNQTPTVTMQPATSITSSSAILNALVDPAGLDTTVLFDYGTAVDTTGAPVFGFTTSPVALTASVGAVAVSNPLASLTSDTDYYARCRATNANGTVTSAPITFHTLVGGGPLPSGPPLIVSNIAVVGVPTQTAITVTAQFDMNNAAGQIHLERLVGATWTDIVAPLNTDAAIDIFTGVANGLSAGTTYQFRARATNPHAADPGGTISGPINATTAPPDPIIPVPSLLLPSNISTTSADVSGRIFSYVECPDSWYFEYGTTTTYGSQTPTVTDTAVPPTGQEDVTATLTSLLPGTLYHYRFVIGRTDGAGGLRRSADATLTTAATPGLAVPVVTTAAATGVTQTTATINGVLTVNF